MHLILTMMLLGVVQDQDPVLPSVSLIEPQIEAILEADRQMVIAHKAEIEAWVKADEEYLVWADVWFNRCGPGWIKHCGMKRRTEPPPPEYLQHDCDSVLEDPDQVYTKACQMLRDYHDDFNTQRDRRAIAQRRADTVVKSTFMKYVHFDFAMVSSESQTWGLWAPIGMHIAIPVKKFNLFVAPGVMMLRMLKTGSSGDKYWQAAYDFGGGWQVKKLRLFGMQEQSKLYVNIMRVYIPAGPSGVGTAKLSMAGLSLNFP